MTTINYVQREIHCRIVYYGPGLCGKTTNLEYIHAKTVPEAKSSLMQLKTAEDRTLYFDFTRLSFGEIKGFRTRFHLYTVPGQVFYAHMRRQILKNVDGVVFVADSQMERTEANLESMEDLRDGLAEHGYNLDKINYVIQYNKRDLPNAIPVEELQQMINPNNVPSFEAIAPKGIGVFDTLKAVSKMVLTDLKKST